MTKQELIDSLEKLRNKALGESDVTINLIGQIINTIIITSRKRNRLIELANMLAEFIRERVFKGNGK